MGSGASYLARPIKPEALVGCEQIEPFRKCPPVVKIAGELA